MRRSTPGAAIATFYEAKIATGRYYMARQLPATALHLARIESGRRTGDGACRRGVLDCGPRAFCETFAPPQRGATDAQTLSPDPPLSGRHDRRRLPPPEALCRPRPGWTRARRCRSCSSISTSVIDHDNLTHRLRLFNSELEDRKK